MIVYDENENVYIFHQPSEEMLYSPGMESWKYTTDTDAGKKPLMESRPPYRKFLPVPQKPVNA
jgi:hypothetical protein